MVKSALFTLIAVFILSTVANLFFAVERMDNWEEPMSTLTVSDKQYWINKAEDWGCPDLYSGNTECHEFSNIFVDCEDDSTDFAKCYSGYPGDEGCSSALSTSVIRKCENAMNFIFNIKCKDEIFSKSCLELYHNTLSSPSISASLSDRKLNEILNELSDQCVLKDNFPACYKVYRARRTNKKRVPFHFKELEKDVRHNNSGGSWGFLWEAKYEHDKNLESIRDLAELACCHNEKFWKCGQIRHFYKEKTKRALKECEDKK